MTQYVALLRAINVGGNNKVTMGALRELASGLGWKTPRTLLTSGNLGFEAEASSAHVLEEALETAVAGALQVYVDVIVRTASAWHAAISANPFPEMAATDPGHLVLMSLKATAEINGIATLNAAITGRESARIAGQNLYITYPDGIGSSKLTASLIETRLGTRGTARNWNTVLKIGEMIM